MQYAYRDRKAKKENLDHSGYRINAGVRAEGLTYANSLMVWLSLKLN